MIPKTPRQRNQTLLGIAQGRPCLIQLDGCDGGGESTVACHSNWNDYGGKGMGRKASDEYTVWGCMSCHFEIDQGKKLTALQKRQIFEQAHQRQIEEWEKITKSMTERPKTREAAKWALDQLCE